MEPNTGRRAARAGQAGRVNEEEMMKRGLRRSGIVLVLAILWLLPAQLMAQETIEMKDQTWDAEFRDHITFTLNAASEAEIVDADLFYQVVGQVATSRNQADFSPGTSIEASFEIDQTKPENYLPPGTELNYWWKVVDADGNELRTEKETLLYLDDRYDWQNLQNERLSLYWYEGNDNFGQELFDRANGALDTLELDMGIAVENPVKIFIYASHSDLLSAISTSAQEWTGGQAFTDYGVVVIGVAPSQLEWGLGATTHEISHLVVHQATKNPFGDLPRWLDEGIAVYNENQEELDDDFRSIFEQAVEADRLMTLRTLSSPFPSDPLQANLAYGQSGAVVMFIIENYGREAMAELLDIFADGALYDEALQQALGVTTDGLDSAFRVSLDLEPLPGSEAAPEAAAAPQPEEAAEAGDESDGGATNADTAEPLTSAQEAAEEVAVPAAEEEPVTVTEDGSALEEVVPAPVQESSRSTDPVSSLPCLVGLLPLLLFGAGAALRQFS